MSLSDILCSSESPLNAPLYDAETDAAATILEETFAEPGAPAKLAWLLEHQYSPAELSFSALKSASLISSFSAPHVPSQERLYQFVLSCLTTAELAASARPGQIT